ncbi:MAG: bifunctional [glutamate--ammonia ligase]-adenylyl-L-tyrosine phosphorylase/[glutamate--ammonia-ligase] adenylyltransferase [Hyphomicrobiales bacterium]|nr:MAG: bifunctional [glutamate--ammonia ligase]-adenylyl-L-tyrosine phosphorylase/[glutamate--ammonia-ligase] adenylyltransferase [Hyphomicrobiales bacterium]
MPGTSAEMIATLPKQILPLNEQRAQELLAEFLECASEANLDATKEIIESNKALGEFFGAVFDLSSYLRDCAFSNPLHLQNCLTQSFSKTIDDTLSATKIMGVGAINEAELMAGLRNNKKQVALLCGLADLGGWLHPSKITRILSQFADASLNATLDFILLQMEKSGKLELFDSTRPQYQSGLIVLAMGKHGGWELNYSSDIDIVLFFDDRAEIKIIGTDPTTLFGRLARQLVKIMQERTSDGYVFRTDLRLRPDPASTPPVIPLEAALNYYEAYGQNWERAAFIKARPAAGDIEAGKAFLKELSPFIWRKYLDYAAIQDVHSIKRQIHSHKGHGKIAVNGHNIKLGRGGIREIEFFVQTQQLIAGGRITELRELQTLSGLKILADLGWITEEAREELAEAYWYLRDVEHRLQMVSDEQTHTLPVEDDELLRIALMMGNNTLGEFSDQLLKTMRTVERHYSELFEGEEKLSGEGGNLVFTGDDDDPGTVTSLQNLGFSRPSDIIRIIRAWHTGRYAALQTVQARELVTTLLPGLLRQLAEGGRPDEALIRFDRFISGLPAGIQLFSLLNSNPKLMRILLQILGTAPRLAEIITRKPHIFDGLLDPNFGEVLPNRETLSEQLTLSLLRAPGYEMALDAARLFAAEQKFLIGVLLFDGSISATDAGHAFTALAEVLIEKMVDLVSHEFQQKHGKVASSYICILGMGKLGSAELTTGSDLDLILLYDHDEKVEKSDGPKPLYVSEYFIRFTQRLVTAMSAPTAEGVLYELDFRLRPSGNAGPLATHISSFIKYQTNDAWTWEALALTRARPIAGDAKFCDTVAKEVTALNGRDRDNKAVRADVLKMREAIEAEKGTDNPWSIKAAKGGLIDIEFLAQWSILARDGDMETDLQSTQSMLETAPDDLLQSEDRTTLKEAHLFYGKVQQLTRICLAEEFVPENAPPGLVKAICATLDVPDISMAEAQLNETRLQVRAIFEKVLSV